MKNIYLKVFILALVSLLILSACNSNQEGSSSIQENASEQENSNSQDNASEQENTSNQQNASNLEEIEIEVATMYATEHPIYHALLRADVSLQERTDGRIKLKLYPNGTYGDQQNSVKAVIMGSLDVFEAAPLTDYNPVVGALFGPYVFRDAEHWSKFKKSDVATDLLNETGEAMDVVFLSLHNTGFRHTLASKPAKTPEEFAGMKMRVVNVKPYPEAATVLNTEGVPLPIVEVYMALKTNVVDATENPVSQMYSMKFYEAQKNLILTGHMATPSSFIMSKKRWDSLSEDDRKLISEVFSAAGDYIDEESGKNEQQWIQKLEAEGVTVTNVDKEPFIMRTSLVLEKYPEWKELYDKIQAIK
jgi:tripartite ATP-independent transporter DctP family solute receptor